MYSYHLLSLQQLLGNTILSLASNIFLHQLVSFFFLQLPPIPCVSLSEPALVQPLQTQQQIGSTVGVSHASPQPSGSSDNGIEVSEVFAGGARPIKRRHVQVVDLTLVDDIL